MTIATPPTPTVFHPQIIPPHPAPDALNAILNPGHPPPSPQLLNLLDRTAAGVRTIAVPWQHGRTLIDDPIAVLNPGPPLPAPNLLTLLDRTGAGVRTIAIPWQNGRRAEDAFAAAFRPQITSISPNQGYTSGGLTVSIFGSGFANATQVYFGPDAATFFVIHTDGWIDAVTPAQGPGAAPAGIASPFGLNTVTPAGVFTYLQPQITSISPNHGPIQGGTTVSIFGSGFANATQVYFGADAAASFVVHSDNWIDAITPVEPAGQAQVAVVTATSITTLTPADVFTFLQYPPPLLGDLATPLPRIARFYPGARLPADEPLLAAAIQPRIPPPLLLAQQAPSSSPVVTAVLRAKRGSAARLDPTTYYTGALAEVPDAVAMPASGTILRAHLTGGNVQIQSSATQGFTNWTTLDTAFAPGTGFGVALAALGHNVAIAYVKSGASSTVQVRGSTNDGQTWGAAVSLANANPVSDVAIAYAPNGDVLLVTGDTGGTIRAFRTTSGVFGAAVTLIPPGTQFINSIALTYAGDWLALFSWADTGQNYIGSAIFGNGSQQTANTWSAVTDVLGIAPGTAPVPQVSGFAWGADGGHAILVEQWNIGGAYAGNPTFAMECNTPAEFAAGYWTEPAPWLYNGQNGADIAPSQVAGANSYAAAGENLAVTLAPPADVDISGRVVSFVFHSTTHGGTLTIALDNSDQTLSYLAQTRNTLGLRLDLALGYITPDGVYTLPQAQRWIVKAEASWVSGRYLVTLTAHDGWQLLHQLVSRRQAHFGDTLGLAAKTVDQIVHWLCARAGIVYTPPQALSTLLARTPDWSLAPEHSLGTAMAGVLDMVEGWLLMTETGATIIPLSQSDPVSYDYGGAGDHPVLQVFHEQELQTANIVTVFAGSTPGARPLTIGAIASDPGDAHLAGMTAHEHSDLWLEQSNAALVAISLLRKAQISVPQHSLVSLPQVGQRLGDVVTLTDPLSQQQFTGRVQTHTITFNRDTSIWTHQTTLSAV